MITLQQIRDAKPCATGWTTLNKALGHPPMNTALSIGDVVISNGLDDALWCLQCLSARERVAAIMPAVRRASLHTTDARVHDCIAALDRWIAGDESVDLHADADAERDLQRADLLAMFPPMVLK